MRSKVPTRPIHASPGAPRRGFTLVEVLVALAIVAIALGAAFRVAGAATANATDYRDRLLARWVAGNVLANARLEQPMPPVGEAVGEALQAGQRFEWRRRITATPNVRFRRVDIEVGPKDAALATLSGFVMAER
jgi:general secretion pathway protein I